MRERASNILCTIAAVTVIAIATITAAPIFTLNVYSSLSFSLTHIHGERERMIVNCHLHGASGIDSDTAGALTAHAK